MRVWLRMGVILGCLGSLAGCGAETGALGPVSPDPSGAEAVRVIRVGSAEEFVNAIAPNRTIQLDPGDYILTDVRDRQMDFVRWAPNFDGNTLTIRNVHNLRIVGSVDGGVRILVRPRYVFVLNFDGCRDVELVNLVMGHTPRKGYCDSGVLGAANCAGLTLRGCDLFGCGTEGLTLNKVSRFAFVDSTIRDCTYGIMTIKGCRDLQFTRSRFVGNREFWGIVLHDTRDVAFVDCTIRGNRTSGGLFQATSCSAIRVTGGAIRDNGDARLIDDPAAVVFKNVRGL